jgi:hypothetical protein
MIIRLYKFIYRKVITKSLDILWNRRSIKLKKFGSKYGEWNFWILMIYKDQLLSNVD